MENRCRRFATFARKSRAVCEKWAGRGRQCEQGSNRFKGAIQKPCLRNHLSPIEWKKGLASQTLNTSNSHQDAEHEREHTGMLGTLCVLRCSRPSSLWISSLTSIAPCSLSQRATSGAPTTRKKFEQTPRKNTLVGATPKQVLVLGLEQACSGRGFIVAPEFFKGRSRAVAHPRWLRRADMSAESAALRCAVPRPHAILSEPNDRGELFENPVWILGSGFYRIHGYSVASDV